MTIPWVLAVLFVLSISVILSISGLILVRKYVHISKLKINHEVAGFSYSVIGTLYAVLLGFTIQYVQERFVSIRENIHKESALIIDVFRSVDLFPSEAKMQIQSSLKKYVEEVVKVEWPLMAQKGLIPHGLANIDKLFGVAYGVSPQSHAEAVLYGQVISRLNELNDARVLRIRDSVGRLSSSLWALLITGGVIVISFMYLFGMENLKAQILITAFLSCLISFMLYTIYDYDHPFEGGIHLNRQIYDSTSYALDDWENFEKTGALSHSFLDISPVGDDILNP